MGDKLIRDNQDTYVPTSYLGVGSRQQHYSIYIQDFLECRPTSVDQLL
jgi:hypothetical protein